MRARIDAIERLIQEDVGRNIFSLAEAARGGLFGAASMLAEAPRLSLGIITGFFVPGAVPPAAETDGPVGAAMLAVGLRRVGVPVRMATDAPCAAACAAALRGADLHDVPLDVVALGCSNDDMIATWRAAGVTHALAIERCGRGADGRPHNMRGEDIGVHVALLDDLFLAGPWETLAVGDGGNEVGMGSLPAGVIAGNIANGAAIACTTPAKHLIVAGVSNWGAYGLLGAMALLRGEWREGLVGALDGALDRKILQATVRNGPAVDGTTRIYGDTVDGLAVEAHSRKIEAVKEGVLF